jgi:hypothetical protein
MSLDMNPEIRAQWCAALRSGDYQQARKALYDGEGYCCLGVLCDLAVKAGAVAERVYTGTENEPGFWQYDGRGDYLPISVREWAGLDDGNPEVRTRTGLEPLGILNDENGLTFAEIADLIDGGAA